MPEKATTTTTPAAPAPKIAGVTTAARAQRAEQERPASEETLSIMPSTDDIASELRIGSGRTPAAVKKTAAAPVEETAEEEETTEATEEPEAETEETTEEETETPGEEPGEEVADETTEETEEATTEEEQEEENLPPEAIRIRDQMQKRVNFLTAKRSEALQRIEELETELESARAGTGENRGASTTDDPLADVTSDRQLEDRLSEARRVKQWALKNRNGGEVQGKDGPISYDADQVAEMLANAEADLDAAPQKRDWLNQSREADIIAQKQAPEFFQKGTPAKQQLDAVLSTLPAAVRAWRPDVRLILIQALVGSHVLRQMAEKKGAAPTGANGTDKTKVTTAPVTSVKKAPPAPGVKTAPKAPATALAARQRAEKLEKAGSRGSIRDLAAVLEDRLT